MAKRAAFTLVELLVVIGIIALMLAILLPTLGRARENANRVKCMSNLKQLGTAFMMYANENNYCFPAPGSNGDPKPEDWIYWQRTRGGVALKFADSRILKYLGNAKNEALFHCPTDVDNLSMRIQNASDVGPYRFSYVMVNRMSSIYIAADSGPQAGKMTHIKRSSQKVLLLEEDERTIDDGSAKVDSGTPNTMAIRHDRKRELPDRISSPMSNIDRTGNACFCDGHVETISRRTLHTQKSHDPFF